MQIIYPNLYLRDFIFRYVRKPSNMMKKAYNAIPTQTAIFCIAFPASIAMKKKRKKSKAPIMFRIRLRCKASRKRTRSFIMPYFMHSRTFRNNSPRTGMNCTQHIHSILSMPQHFIVLFFQPRDACSINFQNYKIRAVYTFFSY